MIDNIKAGADHHASDGGYSEGTQEEYNEFVKGRNQSLVKARIKELEKQCWSHRVDGVLVDGHMHFDIEKFAKLIVRECIHACIADIADPRDTIELKCAKKIKEHFGVE